MRITLLLAATGLLRRRPPPCPCDQCGCNNCRRDSACYGEDGVALPELGTAGSWSRSNGHGETRTDEHYVDPHNNETYDSLKKAKVVAMQPGASGARGDAAGGSARADVDASAALAATSLAVAAAAPPITATARSIAAAPSPILAAGPTAPSATVTDSAMQLLSAGARVKGRYRASSIGKFGTKWWPATVRHAHPAGTCDLLYDDGDVEDGVKPVYPALAVPVGTPGQACRPGGLTELPAPPGRGAEGSMGRTRSRGTL